MPNKIYQSSVHAAPSLDPAPLAVAWHAPGLPEHSNGQAAPK